MTWAALPAKRRKRIESATDVYVALSRLLALWRDDPDRLAVACAAWTLAGYAAGWLPDEVEWTDGVEAIGHEEARALVAAALLHRDRRLLRARAEGLLLALEEFAADAEAARRHDVQVDVRRRVCAAR